MVSWSFSLVSAQMLSWFYLSRGMENVGKRREKGMDELLLDRIVQFATTLNKIVGMGRYEMARA